MEYKTLRANVTNTTGIESVNLSTNHSSACATISIQAHDTDLDIGDEIFVDLGYTDDYGRVFTGYVKGLDRQVPNNTVTISAMDKLIRAVDYFVVSSSAETPYNFGKHILAEDLVAQVLALPGLSIDTFTPTNFEFGINNDVEVNLVGCHDYCRMIADIITWHLWSDENGDIFFKNRKPFFMGADDFGQIGWVQDVPINPTTPIVDTDIIDFAYVRSEKDIRNKVTVYGGEGISESASNSLTYDPLVSGYITVFPPGYYKTAVASYVFIDSSGLAQDIADYNLALYNRVGESISITTKGNYRYLARKALSISEAITGVGGNWYILSSDLSWGKDGFKNSMTLRR